jgi:hypothetical protein
MKYLILLAIFSHCLAARSQNGGETNPTLNKTNTGIIQANSAINQIEGAKKTADRVKGLFKKKEDQKDIAVKDKKTTPGADSVKAAPDSLAVTNTIVTIKGISFMKLKEIKEQISGCEGVKDSDMTFNAETSTIKVAHAGKSEMLLKRLLEKSSHFTENHIESFEEGKILINLK